MTSKASVLALVGCSLALPALAQDPGSIHRRLQEVDLESQQLLADCGGRDAAAVEKARHEAQELREDLLLLHRHALRLDLPERAAIREKIRHLEVQVENLERAARLGIVPKELRAGISTRRGAAAKGGVANDACSGAAVIGPGTYFGDTSAASNDGEASCGSSLFSPDVWFKYVPAQTGTVHADTVGSGYDTVLSVHRGCPGTVGNEVTCNDDASGLQSAVSFFASAGAEYWLRVSGVHQATGPFQLYVGSGSEIRGRVTDAATGDGLESVTVRLVSAQGFTVRTAGTNPGGDYVLGQVAGGSYFARTDNAGPYVDEIYDDLPCSEHDCDATAGAPIALASGETLAGIDFALDLGGMIAGTVTDAGASPASGVWVQAWQGGRRVASSYTAADGTYRIEGLAAGDYVVVATGLEFRGQLYDGLPCPGGPPDGCDLGDGSTIAVRVRETTAGIDFALDRLGTIAGRVTEAVGGAPVAYARLEVWNASGGYAKSGGTDESGDYSIGGLADGTYFVSSDAYSHSDELYQEIPCPGGAPYDCLPTAGTPVVTAINTVTTGIDFTLDRLGAISGTVTLAASGEPVRGMDVYVSAADGAFGGRGYTNATGQYSVDRLAPGDYHAFAGRDGLRREVYDDVPCSSEGCDPAGGTAIAVTLNATTSGIDFALDRLGSISGTVTSAATGEPAAGVRVRLHPPGGGYGPSASTDADGEYTVSGLYPGTYYAFTDNYGRWNDELYDGLPCEPGCSPAAGTPIAVALDTETSGIDFALDRLGSITGIVTAAASGLPLASILVRIYDSVGNVDADYTDFSGRYEVHDLEPGTYWAAAEDYDYLPQAFDGIACPAFCGGPQIGTPIAVAPDTTVSGVDFSLSKLGAISGKVTDQVTGQPVADVPIRVFDAAGDPAASGDTDAEGRYSVGRLHAGVAFVVTATYLYENQLYAAHPCPGGAPTGCDPTGGTPVSVGYDETADGIDFALERLGVVSGMVTAGDTGAPLSGEVQLYDRDGSPVRAGDIDQTGRYQVDGLPTGRYFATTRLGYSADYLDELYDGIPCLFGGSSGCDPTKGTAIEVVNGSILQGIDFSLDPRQEGGAIFGTVRAASTGQPLAGIPVDFWSEEGDRQTSTLTDESGVFRVEISSGIYFVSTDNRRGFVDEVFEDAHCPWGSAYSGRCDPTAGTSVDLGWDQLVTGVDFRLELPQLFADGFESGDLSAWNGGSRRKGILQAVQIP